MQLLINQLSRSLSNHSSNNQWHPTWITRCPIIRTSLWNTKKSKLKIPLIHINPLQSLQLTNLIPLFKSPINETILQMSGKRRKAGARKIEDLIVLRRYKQAELTKKIFNRLVGRHLVCSMKTKRITRTLMVMNLMLPVMTRNSEICLGVKAFIKDREEARFTPCWLSILLNFLMMTQMLSLRKEVSLYLLITNSRRAHQAKFIIWQIIISSQLLYHPCLEVRSTMIIIGTVPSCRTKSCIFTNRLMEVRGQFRATMGSTVAKATTRTRCRTWKVRTVVTWEMALFIPIVGLMGSSQIIPIKQLTVTKPSNHAMAHQTSNSRLIFKIRMGCFIAKWSSNSHLDRWWILRFHNPWQDLRVNQPTLVCKSRTSQTKKWWKRWTNNSIRFTLVPRKRPEEIKTLVISITCRLAHLNTIREVSTILTTTWRISLLPWAQSMPMRCTLKHPEHQLPKKWWWRAGETSPECLIINTANNRYWLL